jgi:hypothetical protein
MQPASSSANTGSGGSKSLKKWGPIGALIAIVVIVVAIVVSSGGGDDTESSVTEAPATSEAPAGSDAPSDSTATGSDTWEYPLSYDQAKATLSEEAFKAIDWGTRCDTEKGTIAVPDFFAVACLAPFTGDNGGATATGVTADEITDPQALGIRTILNGETVQDWNTNDMIFSVAQIIAFLSGSNTLPAGTVILTGTPHGVGMAAKPPRWLRPGDEVSIEIDGIGRLTNPVILEA